MKLSANELYVLFSLRYLLPKKYREEIVGDLIEIKNGLKKEGHGKPLNLMDNPRQKGSHLYAKEQLDEMSNREDYGT